MEIKILTYAIVAIIVMWTMEGINITQIFKKNRFFQASAFYILVGLAVTYLVSSFIFDFLIK